MYIKGFVEQVEVKGKQIDVSHRQELHAEGARMPQVAY